MDVVLVAVGAFFATFEPKDWVTAVLAVGAIVVSVVALAQNSAHHPKPKLTFFWGKGMVALQGGVLAVNVRIRNVGTADLVGCKVRVSTYDDERDSVWSVIDELARGRETVIAVPLVKTDRRITSRGTKVEHTNPGQYKLVRTKVRFEAGGMRTRKIRAPRFRLG